MAKLIYSIILTLTLMLSALPVDAQAPGVDAIHIGDRQKSGAIPGIPAYGNPNVAPGILIASALQIVYIFGALAVLFFLVWGAFDWITSGGDKDKVGAARRKITNSLIGLALLALAAFIISLFGEIVGINPFKMGPIPILGQAPAARTP